MTRILIIDDEPVARQTMANLMAGDDFALECAVDGPSGLVAAKANPPDIILLDVMMPGMDGYTVCTHLRADPELAEVPILMVTAYDDRKSRLRGIGAGADDFISKPFDGLELLTRLRTIARLNRYQRLASERTRFKWVLEQSSDGYVIIDLAGRLIYINAPARLFLGIGEESTLPDAPITEIVKRHYRMEPKEAWSEWPARPLDSECYLVRPETATAPAFWLHVSEQRLLSGAAPQSVLHLRDVTELISARADMRGFRTVLAHKLRTPLNAILVTLELLDMAFEDFQPKEIHAQIGDALNGALRLHGVVNDVLAYTDGLSGYHVGADFPIAHLPAKVAAVGAMLNLDDIKLVVAEAAQTARLPLASAAIEQILFELFENSQKFHPNGAPTILVQVTHCDGTVKIAITDNGLTLSPKQIQWAMTPYLQGEKFFTGEMPGMGLGVPLVAAVLWQVDGEMNMCNRTDAPGVVVELSIPALTL